MFLHVNGVNNSFLIDVIFLFPPIGISEKKHILGTFVCIGNTAKNINFSHPPGYSFCTSSAKALAFIAITGIHFLFEIILFNFLLYAVFMIFCQQFCDRSF